MKLGRNEPCPCGSGAKYKKCCGSSIDRSVPAQNLPRAVAAMNTGRFDEAIRFCETMLAQDKNNVDAHHVAGAARLRLKMWAEAERHLRLAIQLNPNNPFIHSNLAIAYLEQNRPDDAESHCRIALKLDSDLPDTRNTLGNVLKKKGDIRAAVEEYRKAVALDPREPLFRLNLGTALQAIGVFAEAETCYQMVIRSRPDFAEPIAKLGALYFAQERLDEAQTLLRRSFALTPDSTVANNIGLCLLRLGDFSEATVWFKKAIEIQPGDAAAWSNLGLSYEKHHNYADASSAYLRAIHIEPTFDEAKVNLIRARLVANDIAGAHVVALELLQADVVKPSLLPAIVQALSGACDFENLRTALNAAISYIQRGLLPTIDVQALLLFLNYADTVDDRAVYDCHLQWAARIEPALASHRRHFARPRGPRARLRIAYLSPDFRAHSVGFFIQNVVANHDASRFEVYCYSSAVSDDEITKKIRRSVSCYSLVDTLSDANLAARIAEDKIDIAIDLAGHTTWSRVSVLAYRPAPVQITYLGYPNTTGLSTIDYRISDPYVDPTAAAYSEQLLRLPECFLSFGSFAYRGPPTRVRTHGSGVTFGSFNTPAKLNRKTIALWARILHAVPNSRLLLKYRGFEQAILQQHITREFADMNVGADRLILVGRVRSFDEHFQYYNQVDIGLDPVPYNGTTTTCQALWMGVPVVTLVGSMHRTRVSYTILKNIGADDLAAVDENEYVAIAAALAEDRARLENLQRNIPRRLRGSILCDSARFTRQIETAYCQAWESII